MTTKRRAKRKARVTKSAATRIPSIMRWSLQLAAREFGVSRETIRQGLTLAGVEVERGAGQQFSTRQILAAVAGDWKLERTRLTRSQREAQEMANAKKAGTLVEMAAVEVLIRDGMLPISQRLKALASDAAHLANPTDPQLARDALQRWVDQSLPLIRAGMPKLMKEAKA